MNSSIILEHKSALISVIISLQPHSLKKSTFDLGPTSSTPTASKLPYSNAQIRCQGRACARCGHCQDWFWHLHYDKMRHDERRDAKFMLMSFDYHHDQTSYNDRDFHSVCRCNDNHILIGERTICCHEH